MRYWLTRSCPGIASGLPDIVVQPLILLDDHCVTRMCLTFDQTSPSVSLSWYDTRRSWSFLAVFCPVRRPRLRNHDSPRAGSRPRALNCEVRFRSHWDIVIAALHIFASVPSYADLINKRRVREATEASLPEIPVCRLLCLATVPNQSPSQRRK